MTDGRYTGLIERLRAQSDPAVRERTMKFWDAWRRGIVNGEGSWPGDAFESLLDKLAEDAAEAADALTDVVKRAEAAEKERDAAIAALSKASQARGEAEGKLMASHWPGVVEGWKARAEAAEAALTEAVEVVRPFAKAADSFDGRRMDRTKFPDHYPIVMGANVGHARAARAFLAQHAPEHKGGQE